MWKKNKSYNPSTISINDSVKKANPENNPKTNPAMANPILEERDRSIWN